MWDRIGRTSAGAVNQSPLASRVPTIQVVAPPPEVVTAGLYTYSDAATYSGTGNWNSSDGLPSVLTWDLTAVGSNGQPGVKYYSTVGGGSFEFSKFSSAITTGNIIPYSGETGTSYATIEMWYFHIPGSSPRLFPENYSGGFTGWGIGSGSPNYFRAYATDSALVTVGAQYGPLVSGKWYQLVVVYNAGDYLRLYVNGQPAAVGVDIPYADYGIFQDGGVNTLMGGSNPGSVAIIRTYSISLTAEQVLQNYNATKARFTDNPSTVVTTNLINYFDAAPSGVSPTKYSGVGYDSSGVWRDQVGTADITLYNSPTYNSSTNGGNFTFDRTLTQYAASAPGTAPNPNEMTVEIWTQTIAGYTGAPAVPLIANIVDGNNQPWLIRNTSVGAVPYNRLGTTYLRGGSVFNSSTLTALTANTWHQIILRKSGGTGGYMYVTVNGGIYSADSLTSYNYTVASDGQIYLMTNGNDTAFRGGKVAIVRIYNTRLSDAEVLQNYNATKARFGLS
jgi:hypothetical protein